MTVRRFFTNAEAAGHGVTPERLEWWARHGRLQRVGRGIYGAGTAPLSELDLAVGTSMGVAGIAGGRVAGVLLELDAVTLDGPDFTVPPGSSNRRPGVRRRALPGDRVIVAHGVACTDGLQTMIDLAAVLDDLTWEQALESALRKRLTSIAAIEAALPALGRARTPGVARIRRVLALRPPGAPPTESLLETLMVQLVRATPGVPEPVRQHEVYDEHGRLVARLDLAWPVEGAFAELDGQCHEGQPVYDASRETAVVAATGWLCGRWTWREVVFNPRACGRRVRAVVAQAARRPLPPTPPAPLS